MSFGAPQWFWGLLLIPFLTALFIWSERRGAERLQQFVSARLLPQLAGTVNRFRRFLRFALLLIGFAFAMVALAQPRWGYMFQDVQRKGLDLIFAVDTSRSMLSNDVPPNRLERVKLATQDLINELQGDRLGLIAFAGRAFVQAPLTIDYGAVTESINDLDTKTIPEGGTNISQAIGLAVQTFGKSATGNRALIIFTDGEELSGDAVKAAKAATDAGVRIFTVGVGTPEGSLIPITGEEGGTAFVKDQGGQVVKSKLDEKRLREMAAATGGFYLHLENGPRTMKQIYAEGLAKMQASDFDVRLSRRPIERYEWPLGAAVVALSMSILIGERKRVRVRARIPARAAFATASLLLLSLQGAFAAAAGLQLYHDGKYDEAYGSFQEDLRNHPDSAVKDKVQFDAGTAAYKMRDYNKAVESFSQALLSKERGVQENSHYNMGRTLEERADMDKSDEEALTDLTNAQAHYEDVLKLNPKNQSAKDNLEIVKKKIERLKNRAKPTPTPTPPPQQQKKDEKNKQGQQDQQQQSSGQGDQEGGQGQQQQQQSQDRQGENPQGSQKDEEKKDNQAQAKNEPQKKDQSKPGESPSPSPSAGEGQSNQSSPAPSAGEQKGDQKKQSKKNKGQQEPSPSPAETGSPSPSPGSGEGSDENAPPSPTPSASPQKKFAGEVKGAAGNKSEKPPEQNTELAQAEEEKQGKMSERQAEALLQSMKDEEARVQLDERKPTRRVYNDW
jgi:Ca-activated chloride channel family protein